MKKIKKLSILFLVVFILSSSISVFAITRPSSLGGYDGNALRAVALSQVGNSGDEKYWKWCGFETRVDWCACFVSWCLANCYGKDSVSPASLQLESPSPAYPAFSSCAEFISWFKSNRLWYGTSVEPLPGMIIFFDWEGDGTADHMGIVNKIEDRQIYVIEGNSGNQCAINNYDIDSPVIFGYGAAWQDIIGK